MFYDVYITMLEVLTTLCLSSTFLQHEEVLRKKCLYCVGISAHIAGIMIKEHNVEQYPFPYKILVKAAYCSSLCPSTLLNMNT